MTKRQRRVSGRIFVRNQRILTWWSNLGGQNYCESAPLPYSRFNTKAAAVAIHDVFDDREAQTGAAELLGAVAVDSIESLRETWNMDRIDPVSCVRHRENGSAATDHWVVV